MAELDELKNLMQEIAKSTKSMADDMHMQTSRQEKLLLNKAAKEDAKNLEARHSQQQAKLQELGEAGEEQRNVQEETLKVQVDILNQQKNDAKKQTNTTEYLKTLADVTKQNREELKSIRDESSKLRGGLAKVTRGLTTTERVTDEFASKDKTLGGFKILSGLAGGLSGLTSLTKQAKDYATGGRASNKRQASIEDQRKSLNKNKQLLSAEMSELEEAKQSGDSGAVKSARESILSRRKTIKASAESFSKVMSEEFLYQQNKKRAKKDRITGGDADTLMAQSGRNIKSATMRDAGIFGKGKGLTGGANSASDSKFIKVGAHANADAIINSNVSVVSGPSTYGQFVAGTYDEIKKLNKTKVKGGKGDGNKTDVNNKGGFFSKLVGIGTGLLGVFTSLTKYGGVALNAMKGASKAIWSATKNTTTKLFDMTKKASSAIWDGLKKGGSKVLDVTKNAAGKTWDFVKGGASKLTSGVKNIGSGVLDKSKSLIKDGGKGLSKSSTKMGTKAATKVGSKSAAKLATKAIGKSVLKKIPVVGLLAGLGFGINKAMDGDFTGAGLEVLSGGASLLPGLGTGASLAIDAGLAARDMGVFDKDKTKNKDKDKALNTKPLNTTSMNDEPQTQQKSFRPATTEAATSSETASKLTEFQMLSKMIVTEQMKMYQGESYKAMITQQNEFTAEAIAAAIARA